MTEGTVEQVLLGEAQWCVVRGDCVELMRAMNGARVDHIITDPPYSEYVHSKSRAGARRETLRDGNGRISRCAIDREREFGFENLSDATRDQCGQLFPNLVMRWVLVFSDIESASHWRYALTRYGATPLQYARTGAWLKIGGTPQFTGDRPGVGFEAISIFHPKGRKRWNGGGKLGVWSHLTCIERGGQSTGNNSRHHPTQKPLQLMLELIADFTDVGDIVLDPFSGSGTTGVACLRLGRRFIGIELNEEWAELSRERLRAEQDASTLAARRSGQLALFGGGS